MSNPTGIYLRMTGEQVLELKRKRLDTFRYELAEDEKSLSSGKFGDAYEHAEHAEDFKRMKEIYEQETALLRFWEQSKMEPEYFVTDEGLRELLGPVDYFASSRRRRRR